MANHGTYHPRDPFFYLRASLISLGIAGGIAAVAWWGRFNGGTNIALSLAIFPVVLGLAFFSIYIMIALLTDRYAAVKGIIALALLAVLLLLSPVLYDPDLTSTEQAQRWSIIPFGIAVAIIVGYLVSRWLDRQALEQAGGTAPATA